MIITDITPKQFAALSSNPNLYLMQGAVVSRVQTLDRAALVAILPKATIVKHSDGVLTCTVRVVK